MLNQLQRGDEPALLPCRRSGFLRRPELGAVLLGDRLEIGSEIESHAAYLGHWIELLKESPKVLFQVLSEARQAADLICPEASGQLEAEGAAHPA